MIVCAECGNQISKKAKACPKCGCPIDISKKNIIEGNKIKYKRYVIIILLVLVIMVMAVMSVKSLWTLRNKDGYYNGVKWGTSLESIKSSLGEEGIVSSDGNSVMETKDDYDQHSGLMASITYQGEDDKLDKVFIMLTANDESPITSDSIIDWYVEKLDVLYGKNESTLGIMFEWETEKSEITLMKMSSDIVTLKYEEKRIDIN